MCHPGNAYDWEHCNLGELAWEAVTEDNYKEEHARSIIDVTIMNEEEHIMVKAALFFDKRKQHSYGGRALLKDVPLFHKRLLKGDRLETNENVPDIHAFDLLKTYPLRVRFWRTSTAKRLNRECILFRIPGVFIHSLSTCSLHTLDLGVVSRYVAFCLHFLLVSTCWNMPGSAVEELMHNNLPRIRGMLKQHYKKMRAQDPSSKASQVHDLTLGMIGPKENPDMSQCGGAARRSLLPFVVEVLEKFQITLPQPCAGHLMRAGNALKHYFDMTRAFERRMPRHAVQSLFDCAIVHNKAFELAGGLDQPKHHAFLHLIEQSLRLGNPRLRSTYRNESLNGTVAIMARSVHRSTFIQSILQKYGLLQLYCGHLVSGNCIRSGFSALDRLM